MTTPRHRGQSHPHLLTVRCRFDVVRRQTDQQHDLGTARTSCSCASVSSALSSTARVVK
jgi:hypothetical protein